MGRSAENSTTLPNGRVVGYGLVDKGGLWRVRFSCEGKRVEVSTGTAVKGEARTRAVAIIRDRFDPSASAARSASWDEIVTFMEAHPHLRPASRRLYLKSIKSLRLIFPDHEGPAALTPKEAAKFLREFSRGRSANTVRNAYRHLSSLFAKHLRGAGYVESNPWDAVDPPPEVRHEPRAPTDEEFAELMTYLEATYPGWTLIRLFVQLKAYTGCRTGDVCALRSDQLRDGRIFFDPDQTKTRAGRSVPLPPEMLAGLESIKGETYLWERFASDAVKYRPNNSKGAIEFSPSYLYWAVAGIFKAFNKSRPGKPRLRPHDLRRRALTQAAILFGTDAAARAIGVDPQTARRYYIDAQRASKTDEVFGGLADWWRFGGGGAKPGEGEAKKTP